MVAARRLQLRRRRAISRRRCAAARACSPASRSTSGSRTRSATPACCTGFDADRQHHGAGRSIRIRIAYKPTNVTGAPAASYELNVTDDDFKFPQVWRTNIAVDRRLPGGITGTAEFIYNRDVNGIYYINANLPAAQTAFTGADTRPRWTDTTASTTSPATQSPNAIVLKNQDVGRTWNLGVLGDKTDVARASLRSRLQLRRSQEHHRPGLDRVRLVEQQPASPATRTTRASASRPASPGHRFFLAGVVHEGVLRLRRHDVLGVLGDAARIGNTSYMFAGDVNGDGGTTNDLIYIPRDTSEMNFQTFTASGVTFTAEQQAAAFEALHRAGRVPERAPRRVRAARRRVPAARASGWTSASRRTCSRTSRASAPLPVPHRRPELRQPAEQRTGASASAWCRIHRCSCRPRPAAIDAQGRAQYRLQRRQQRVGDQDVRTDGGLLDVYQFMLSFRYFVQIVEGLDGPEGLTGRRAQGPGRKRPARFRSRYPAYETTRRSHASLARSLSPLLLRAVVAVGLGPTRAGTRHHRLPDLGIGRRAAAVHQGRAADALLRVRRCARGVRRGAEGRPRVSRWPTGARR